MSVPEGWKETTLANIVDQKISYGIVQAGQHDPCGIPYIKSSDIKNNQISNFKNLQRTSKEVHRKYIRSAVHPGDIVFSLRGNIGASAIVPADITEANLTQGTARISITNKHDIFFILNYLLFENTAARILRASKGSTFKEISIEELRRISILTPPLAEQKKIATILSTWDKAIAATDKLLENARQQKKALMQQLLTGKKRLPGFSGEWVKKALCEVSEIDPENLSGATIKTFEFNYISLESVTRGKLDAYQTLEFKNAPSRARRIVCSMDLLVSTVRPTLMSHLLFNEKQGKWICSTGFCVVRCQQSKSNPQYIFQLFFANYINKQINNIVTGSNYPAISSSDVGRLSIPLPSLPEQQAIARVLTTADKEIDALTQKAALLRQEKRALMQQLLTGKKRVRVEA